MKLQLNCETATGRSPGSRSPRRRTGQIGFNPQRIAFTLIELLVVIAIIGILTAMVRPALSRTKQLEHRTACLSNVHRVGRATDMYLADDVNRMPFVPDSELQLTRPVDASGRGYNSMG